MRPRSPWWYAVALLLVFGGYMVGLAVAGGAWNLLAQAPIQSVTTPIDAQNRTVGVYTDVLQDDRDIACRTGGPDKPQRPIPEARINTTTVQEGQTWTLIGVLPSGFDDLQVVCTPKDDEADTASYGMNASSAFTSRIQVGNGIIWMTLAAGIGLGVWTILTRRRVVRDELAAQD